LAALRRTVFWRRVASCRDNLEALLQSARRISELATQLADEAVRRMSDSALAPR
jgi:hypothetical protein